MQTKIDSNFCYIVKCPLYTTNANNTNQKILCSKNNSYYCKYINNLIFNNIRCVFITKKGRLRKKCASYFLWIKKERQLQIISAYLKCKKKHSVTS